MNIKLLSTGGVVVLLSVARARSPQGPGMACDTSSIQDKTLDEKV